MFSFSTDNGIDFEIFYGDDYETYFNPMNYPLPFFYATEIGVCVCVYLHLHQQLHLYRCLNTHVNVNICLWLYLYIYIYMYN